MLRVTGKCVRVERKSGVKITNSATGEGRAWAFDLCTVLVAQQSVVEVTRFSDAGSVAPTLNANVDWAVNVKTNNFGLQYGYECDWAELEPELPYTQYTEPALTL